ncbi:Imm49 family immunity protein [Nocardia abscessus]|uniref:Imm49 family immunity protein n=1 Tax=Nocardia abscessus TaxID=120957 RepID=UPI002456D48B|nr:Imm49 family immunity protein [Nocardia abscessus]
MPELADLDCLYAQVDGDSGAQRPRIRVVEPLDDARPFDAACVARSSVGQGRAPPSSVAAIKYQIGHDRKFVHQRVTFDRAASKVGAVSANRDPEVFSDPETFDPTRFSSIHVWLSRRASIGALLAELELEIALEATLRCSRPRRRRQARQSSTGSPREAHHSGGRPSHGGDSGNWLIAFWLAIVCRDQDRMTRLAEVPRHALRSAEVRYDEYVYRWGGALQAYRLERPAECSPDLLSPINSRSVH